jgi:hypothetical protein
MLIWRVHPSAWKNPILVDQLAQIIPFLTLIKHEDEARALNLPRIIMDIVGRIERNPDIPVQVLIIKWLIHTEWLSSAFMNIGSETEKLKIAQTKIFADLMQSEIGSRLKLIAWLKIHKYSIEDGEALFGLVDTAPLSLVRAGYIYASQMMEKCMSRTPKIGSFNCLQPFYEVFSFFHSGKKVFNINDTEIEMIVSKNVSVCTDLIRKYFKNPIENQIAKLRISVVNLLKLNSYGIIPNSPEIVFNIHTERTLPISDVQHVYCLLSRLGLNQNWQVVIKAENQLLKASHEHDTAIHELRNILLKQEIESRIALKNIIAFNSAEEIGCCGYQPALKDSFGEKAVEHVEKSSGEILLAGDSFVIEALTEEEDLNSIAIPKKKKKNKKRKNRHNEISAESSIIS